MRRKPAPAVSIIGRPVRDRGTNLRLAVLLAMLAGVSVAFQASLTSAAQRTLGPVVLVAISSLTTSLVALAISVFLARPEFTARAVVYAVVSGVLGALILGSIAFAAGQGGVARALSLVIGTQLVAGLLVDRIGLFGAGAGEIGAMTVLGVLLIFAGGVLVVRY
jgi:bacterial/archaeal transporter family-2 protein